MATSLFQKYGGFAKVNRIVSAFYEKVIDSDVTGPYFDDVDVRALIDHQTKFIAQVMGGPASYSDEALRKVHAPHDIDRAAFDEMARLLRETLEEAGFDPEDVADVMAEIEARSRVVISGGGA